MTTTLAEQKACSEFGSGEPSAVAGRVRVEEDVRELLQNRLDNLKKEFEAGQAQYRELETKQVHLRETLLRISGAIQVLGELLAASKDEDKKVSESSHASAACRS